MRSLDQLDLWISDKVRNWSRRIAGAAPNAEIIEIRRDILNEIRDQIRPKGEGKNVFPFNAIAIHLIGANPGQEALFEGALGDRREWEETIVSLLEEAECSTPTGLQVSASVTQDPDFVPESRPFRIEFANAKPAGDRSAPKIRPEARVTVVLGQADVRDYVTNGERINLGRMKEVTSDKEGLRRRNHIAFAEAETSVSREHAYIRYDEDCGRFRLYDSMSQRGTHVFRDGRKFDVPKGALRGFQLRSGDEIHLGDARLRFDTDDAAES